MIFGVCALEVKQFFLFVAKLFLVLLAINISIAAADNIAEPHPQLTWNGSLGHSLFANATDDLQMVEAALNFKGQYPLTSSFNLLGEIALQMKTGMAQSRYPTEEKGPIQFKSAYLRMGLHNGFAFAAGALPLDYLQSPLLLGPKSFPGMQELYQWQSPTSSIQLTALQAIPTSSSYASARTEKVPTPWFFAHTGVLETQSSWAKYTITATHFRYSQLPPKVAYQSAFFGNSLQDTSEPTASFRFPFYGYSAGGKITVPWEQRYLALGLLRLENLGASYGRGRGEIGSLQLGFPLGENFLSLQGEKFFNETDSAPAYYNSAQYGNNNRQGYAFEIELKMPSYHTKIKARWVDTKVIEVNSWNSNEQSFFINLETDDVTL